MSTLATLKNILLPSRSWKVKVWMVLASLEKRPSVALDKVVEKDGHIIAGLVYKQQAFDSLVFPYMTCPCSPVSSVLS